jgi:colanic acid/amylovoran biosynthesis protein
MIIEIRGVQFENKGAQLMLHAVLQQLSDRLPTATVALRPNAGTTYRELCSVAALIKVPLRKQAVDLNPLSYSWPTWLDVALQNFGVVAEGSVDAVLDASGFAYGDRWGSAALDASTAELLRFKQHGKPYVFLPQAFGPFKTTSAAAREWAAALASSPLVAVRDQQSAASLRALMPSARNIHLYPDITVGLTVTPNNQGQQYQLQRSEEKLALLIPNVRLLEQLTKTTYLSALTDIAAQLSAAGYRVQVLNHGGKEDAALCRDLCETTQLAISTIIENQDPRILKAIIGSASLVVSSRFHACIAALSQGVPCYAIAWTHKYRELFESFGCGQNVMNATDLAGGTIDLRQRFSQSCAPDPTLLAATAQQRSALKTLWDEVFRVLTA